MREGGNEGRGKVEVGGLFVCPWQANTRFPNRPNCPLKLSQYLGLELTEYSEIT